MKTIGDKILGNKVYGKKSLLTGEIIDIFHPEDEGDYIMEDIITVKWNDGTISKFYRKHLI